MLTLLVLAMVSATPQNAGTLTSDTSRDTLTSSQIKAHNAPLDVDDANYIRCRKTPQTGSLVKKTNMCRTNREWRIAADNGNRDARDIARQANYSARVE